MPNILDQLIQNNPLLWRGNTVPSAQKVMSTGFAGLDAALPGGGWPTGGVIELITSRIGVGELQLMTPLMAELSACGRWIVWVAPPLTPYAPALRQAGVALARVVTLAAEQLGRQSLAAAERLLRSGGCGLVLLWPDRIRGRDIRRLQLAAAATGSIAVVFRVRDGGGSPAALRLALQPVSGGLQVDVLKARGAYGGASVKIVMPEGGE